MLNNAAGGADAAVPADRKLRRSYEKPSERRAREQAEAVRRHRKLLRKRMEREGY